MSLIASCFWHITIRSPAEAICYRAGAGAVSARRHLAGRSARYGAGKPCPGGLVQWLAPTEALGDGPKMLMYALRRLVELIPVLLGISIVTFLLIRLVPGDVVA